MSVLFPTESKEIGGRTFTVRVLSFSEARKVYSKLQKLLAGNEEVIAEAGVGLFMFAGLAGAINDEDMKAYIDAFGPSTSVAIDATRTMDLNSEATRNIVFAGRFEDMFEWLDFCVDVNFKAVVAKLQGAVRALAARQVKQTAQE